MIDANALLPASGPIAWAAMQNVSNSNTTAAAHAAITATAVKTGDSALPAGISIIGLTGVIWTPSGKADSPPAAAVTVGAADASAAPGRLIFSVFFWVTEAESPAAASTVGSTESGIREVCRAEGTMGGFGATGVAPGTERSDGRFKRMVFGPSFSAPTGATPIAESSEMREVLDLAACT